MTDEASRWIEAGKVLAADAHARVTCPRCGVAELEVTDVSSTPSVVERHMRCPGCGAHNALLLRQPDEMKSETKLVVRGK